MYVNTWHIHGNQLNQCMNLLNSNLEFCFSMILKCHISSWKRPGINTAALLFSLLPSGAYLCNSKTSIVLYTLKNIFNLTLHMAGVVRRAAEIKPAKIGNNPLPHRTSIWKFYNKIFAQTQPHLWIDFMCFSCFSSNNSGILVWYQTSRRPPHRNLRAHHRNKWNGYQ